jgi:hypothetical protein
MGVSGCSKPVAWWLRRWRLTERIDVDTIVYLRRSYFDDETCRIEPIDNSFGPNCYPCLRNRPKMKVASPTR